MDFSRTLTFSLSSEISFWLLKSICLCEQFSSNLQLFWNRKYLQTFGCLFMQELNVQLWVEHISFTCCLRQLSPNLQKPHWKYLQTTSIFIFLFLFFWSMKLLFVKYPRDVATQTDTYHKCFKCWWLALPEEKRITKPLINSTFNHGLHEGPSYTVLTIIKEFLRQYES